MESLPPWDWRSPGGAIERFHRVRRYKIDGDHGATEVRVAEGSGDLWGRSRGRIVVFGRPGPRSSTYEPWTEFVETDTGKYSTRLPNPVNPRTALNDGDRIPPRYARAEIRRNDELFGSVQRGPALRLVLGPHETEAMIRHALWVRTLKQVRG
jgi:hypothetical protein